MTLKAMTLRLEEEKADELEAVARADEMPVTDAIRDAIDAHIQARREDAVFQARLHEIAKKDAQLLKRLAS